MVIGPRQSGTASVVLAWLLSCLGGSSVDAAIVPERPVLRMLHQSIALADSHQAFDIGEAITIEVWVFQTEPISYDAEVFGRRCDGGCETAYRVTMAHRGESEWIGMQYSRNGSCCAGIGGEQVTIPQRQWIHIAAVVGATLSRFYVAGVEVGANDTPAVTPAGSGEFRIGPGFQGGMADLRIWNRALAADEIGAIAAGGAPATLDGLAAHWPLDDGAGQVARDIGANALDLQLGGGPEIDSMRDPQWITAGLLAEGPFFERHLSVAYEDLPSLVVGEGIAVDGTGDGRAELLYLVGPPVERWVCEYPYYVGAPSPQGSRFRNRGDGTLELDQTVVEFQLSAFGFKHVVGDFTGDGVDDVFVFDTGPEFAPTPLDCGPPGEDGSDAPGGQNRLFVGNLGGPLREETLQRVPPRISYDHAGSAADIDGDNDLDVYAGATGAIDVEQCWAGNFFPGVACPVILVNDGHGFFTEDHTRLPDSLRRRSPGHHPASAFADVDGDSDADLVLGGNQTTEGVPGRALVLRNDGTGRFADTPLDTFPVPPGSDRAWTGALYVASADFDGDGFVDLLMSQNGPTNLALYFNQGDGTFRDGHRAIPQSDRPQALWGDITQSCEAATLNEDGAPDLLCAGLPHIYLNRGDGTFEVMPPVDDVDLSQDLYASDVDGDGDTDLIGGLPVATYLQVKPFRPITNLQPGPPPGHWQVAPGGTDILVKTRMHGRANPTALAALLAALADDLRTNGDAAVLALPPRLGLEVWLKRLSDERIFYRKAPAALPRRLPATPS